MQILNDNGLDASPRDVVELNWPYSQISSPLLKKKKLFDEYGLEKKYKCFLILDA
jgi:hypothetical protein